MRGRPQRGRTVRTVSVPAPVGGLNAKDALADMPPTDAIIMDNWVPSTSSVVVRQGYAPKCTGFTAPVETLATYRNAAAQKLFAISGGSWYDITSATVRPSPVAGTYGNSRFQYVNFGTAGGEFLVAVNGSDKAVLYDGTTFKPLGDGAGQTIAALTSVGTVATLSTAAPHGLVTGDTVTVMAVPTTYNVTAASITVTSATTFIYNTATAPGTPATSGTYTYGPSVQGVDTGLWKDVNIYGRRLWFTEKQSFRVWYLGLESIAGTASSIDLAPLFPLGGSLQGTVVWTVASELSTTSYIVFVSSEGECAMYAGLDPDNTDTFGLAGTFRIGKPIGQRFWERVGTDTILITQDGLIPISKAAINNRQQQSDAISYKITNLISDDTTAFGGQFGWEVILYPAGDKLILNSPRSSSADTVQYVQNTITNSWCRYKNLPSYCFELYLDNIYFGSDTTVFQCETGNSDNGAGILSDLQPAYSYFGSEGTQKIFTTLRPIITSNGNFQPSIGISTDFTTSNPTSTPTLSLALGGPIWNIALWNVSGWGGATQTTTGWQWIGGIGFAASARISAATKNMQVSLASLDYVFELSTGIY